jgi:hypothetical protein
MVQQPPTRSITLLPIRYADGKIKSDQRLRLQWQGRKITTAFVIKKTCKKWEKSPYWLVQNYTFTPLVKIYDSPFKINQKAVLVGLILTGIPTIGKGARV